MIDAITARLKAQVSVLEERVEGAASFANLMKSKALPTVTPAAHVIPLGLQGGAATSASGAFTQMFAETIGVILTFRTYGRTGEKALEDIGTVIRAVIEAICGWGPNDEIGVFQLSRGNLVNMSAGTIVYQLDFSITDQLRILS
ncbi:MAG: hypothetical protein JKX71_12915 [Amylibacter sp.]|nr:hypothetical protein [Amylibacter sp.]